MNDEPVELAPARAAFSLAGLVGLGFDVGGGLVALLFVSRPAPMLMLFAGNAILPGVVSLATWRRGLRRVVVPIPHRAVVVASGFPTARLVGSVLATVTTLGLSIAGVVSPAVLGAGVGAEVGLLWSAWKIREFERADGRQVLRATHRRRGEPALYAAPSEPTAGRSFSARPTGRAPASRRGSASRRALRGRAPGSSSRRWRRSPPDGCRWGSAGRRNGC